LPLPIFAQAALEKAALDSAAAGGSQFPFDISDLVGDGRIVLWILVAVVVFLIFRSFRRPAQ
jgi:hypothetical protein